MTSSLCVNEKKKKLKMNGTNVRIYAKILLDGRYHFKVILYHPHPFTIHYVAFNIKKLLQ